MDQRSTGSSFDIYKYIIIIWQDFYQVEFLTKLGLMPNGRPWSQVQRARAHHTSTRSLDLLAQYLLQLIDADGLAVVRIAPDTKGVLFVLGVREGG